VKIGGERAYKLARRGVAVAMPLRRSTVYALDAVSWTGPADAVSAVRLELHVSSGTYVRSIAQALGGHCTSLRRTAVGPFTVDEAAGVESVDLVLPSVALARLPQEAVDRVPASVRSGVLALEPPQGEGAA
jgi:tRNA pseudouridine55 synthase